MRYAKDYKKGVKIMLNRLRTGKTLNVKQRDLLISIKEYLNTKNFKIDNFDYHLKNNTKEYQKQKRLFIRFDMFAQSLDNNILVYGANRQYDRII